MPNFFVKPTTPDAIALPGDSYDFKLDIIWSAILGDFPENAILSDTLFTNILEPGLFYDDLMNDCCLDCLDLCDDGGFLSSPNSLNIMSTNSSNEISPSPFLSTSPNISYHSESSTTNYGCCYY